MKPHSTVKGEDAASFDLARLTNGQTVSLHNLLLSLRAATETLVIVKNRSNNKDHVKALMPLIGAISSCELNGAFEALLADQRKPSIQSTNALKPTPKVGKG
jgi:hypothetical protein